ncbi:phosphoadenosine phosphosulfate reductase [Streptomyces sp. SID13666]|uniref:phosphoadenosine phosphosulfate reductase n=1 Tax=Streptomyces sp. SID13666 TaxID=2706054 RepID=UPI0031BAA193
MTKPVPKTASEPVKAFSFGGGWQSMAALVLAAQGTLDYRTFIFANVGDDSEKPATLAYVRDHARPFAAAHGIDLTTVGRIRRDGTPETLYGRITREGSRSLPIPVRMSNGAPGTRACTGDFKIKVIGKELKRRGASRTNPATVGIGISVDEISRANNRRCEPHERIEYPLLELGIRRTDCARIIRSAGLPVPPKSACWFCPFSRPENWHDMRRDEPALFAKACDLEALLNRRRDTLGKDHVWLTRFLRPLAVAIPDGVDTLPFDDADPGCDSGWCMT